jgi:membrane protease subunit HflK
MSWNNGGPWGSPGGSSGGPSGGTPGGNPNDRDRNQRPQRPANNGGPPEVDVDEWLRRSQEQLRKAFPGRSGEPNQLFIFALLALIVLWLASGFYQVATNEVGVVLRFGEAVRTEQPGLRYHLPEPIESVLTPDVTTTHQIKIGFRDRAGSEGNTQQPVETESRMLTGDENLVDIGFSVFWRVRDAQEYLFNIRNPELTVKLASESAIREIVGRMAIQPVLTEKRSEIEAETELLIQAMLDEYKAGIIVTQVQLLNVQPPQPVVDAFNDVQRARADAERARNEAEAYRNDVLPRARGEAQRMIQESEGYKEQVISIAKGDASRFESVLKAYDASREVTATRLYFEAMEDVLRNANKIIIGDGVGKSGAMPYLPLQDFIRNRKEATP